jgi:DNA primase catalytic core
MARYNDTVLDEIRARVDIVDLIGSRVPLKRAGGTYKGCCPFHKEKTPSFNVNPNKQFYKCFGCGEAGDIFTFLMKMEGLQFMDAVRMLADKAGVVLKQEVDPHAQSRSVLYAIHAELAAFYQRCLVESKQAEEARKYLASRSLPEEVIKSFCIGYAPAVPRDALLQWAKKHDFTPQQLVEAGVLVPPKDTDRQPNDYFHRFGGRLMFPICDRQGRVVAFSGRILDPKSHPAKYVNSPETDIFKKSHILYALDKAATKIVKHPRREAIICEGQIDVIRCHACGFETAVASQGTAFTAEHVALLKKHADSVVLVFDGDAAGKKAAIRTGALFIASELPVRVAALPKGEDPDSFLRNQGATAFREILDQSVSITAFQVDALRGEESNPNSIDAVNRISHGVIAMLSECTSAVQRAHLAEEAAKLLHVPMSAFEEDLDRFREQAKQKAEYAARFRAEDKQEKIEQPAQSEGGIAEGERPPEGEGDFHPADDYVVDVGEWEVPPPPEPPSKTEYELCEFLVEHEHDRESLLLMSQYLPLDILRHLFTRTVVSAILEQFHSGKDKVAELGMMMDPQWRELLSGIIANKQKMLSAREATSLDAAKDLLRKVWIDQCLRARDNLDAQAKESDTTRLLLSCRIVRLRTEPWERAREFMSLDTTQTPLMPSARPGAGHGKAGAATSLHEGGTAYEAPGSSGFQPSELPPDEMLD